jgi:DNA-binding FadR family transcriptional regulator
VSLTVTREALSMLLALDMLDVKPKVGTRARRFMREFPQTRIWLIGEDRKSVRFRPFSATPHTLEAVTRIAALPLQAVIDPLPN